MSAQQGPPSNQSLYIAAGMLTAMVIWFCDEIIFAQKIPFFRDLVSYFYPIKFSVAEAFHAGTLPLWERRMAAGFPIMAAFQSAVFYPPTLAFYWWSFLPAIQFTFVFHYFVAAAGAFILLRSWRFPMHVALIGTALFAFGGTTVSLTNLLNHFQSAVWLPWVIYFWEQALRYQRWKNIIAFAMIALCQLLAGSPEIFALTMGLVMLDAVRFRRDQGSLRFFRALAILFGAGLIVIGLGMVQLLPTAELIAQSRRDQPIPASEALGWSLRPSSLLGLFLPMLEPDATLSIGIRLLLAQNVPFLLSHYMGVITVFALCCWIRTARMKECLFVLTAMASSLLLAFGQFTPIYPFLYEWVPVFRVLRFPEKYYYVVFALLVFAAVRGLRRIDEQKYARSSGIIATAIFAAWCCVYLVFRARPDLLAGLLQPAHHFISSTDPKTIASILVLLEKQLALALMLAALFWLNYFDLIRKTLWQVLLVLTVFLDLNSANKPLHFLQDAALIDKAPSILQQTPADFSRLFYYPPGDNLHPAYVRVTGTPDYGKVTEIALNNLLPNAGMLHGFEFFQDIDALGRRSYTEFLNFINGLRIERRAQLLAALNVRYVVAFHPLEIKGLKLVREFPEHFSRLYEIGDPVPRVYIVAKATYEPDAKTTFARLSSDGFDARREVILETQVELQSKGDFRQFTKLSVYRDTHVEVEAQLNQSGILVLTDAFHPGWKVRVDGVEHKLLRANYLFRAVELPAGNHKVVFDYEPESFKVGLIVSLCTAGLIVAVPTVGWFRRRSRNATAPAQLVERPLSVQP
jgi:hypothetical protein